MNTRSKGLTVVFFVLGAVLIVLLGSYFWSDDSSVPPKLTGSLKPGEKVKVIVFLDAHVKVEREDGTQVYVKIEDFPPGEVEKLPPAGSKQKVIIPIEIVPDKRPPPRSKKAISDARVKLPVLYLTKDMTEVYGTRASGATYVDPATGRKCWLAYECRNPGCTGKGKSDRPFLFVNFNYSNPEPSCPACSQSQWARPYKLPEAINQVKALDEEALRRIQLNGQPQTREK